MNSGLLIVRKEKGQTSRDVVNQVCKIFHTRKVGHTGTLDPLAEGVLVLGINDGTKVIELLTDHDKEYVAEVVIGIETDTLDVTGEVLKVVENVSVTDQEIKDVLSSFLGSYLQEVPIFSALHYQGKRLYEYARNQEVVELPKREVTIQNIEWLDSSFEDTGKKTFRFCVSVSKGTYIRSLIRDIGEKLGIPCTMKSLLRTRVGEFSINQAALLNELNSESSLLRIEDFIPSSEKIIADKDLEKRIENGQVLVRVFDSTYGVFMSRDGRLLAIYQVYDKDTSMMKPYKVFSGRNL